MPDLTISNREMVKTPYGAPSGPLLHGELNGVEVTFLPRHGRGHTIPPHKINYRANITALHEVGVTHTIAVASVGGIHDDCTDGTIIIPDQIIDYTYARKHTFYDGKSDKFDHIDFTCPYDEALRQKLIKGAEASGVAHLTHAVYGATQGPRLESAAEINRMERDGCTVVGMTGMPEAALAREIGLHYACCGVVVNRAAGKGPGTLDISHIEANLEIGIERVKKVLDSTLKLGVI